MKVFHVRSLRVLSVIALGVAGVVGCRHDSSSTQTTAVATQPGPQAVVLSDAAGEVAADWSRIHALGPHALGQRDRQGHRAVHRRRPRHSGADPDVVVTDGIASLSGSVANLLARDKDR